MVLLMEPCLSGVSHLFGDRFMYLMVQAYLKAYIIITIRALFGLCIDSLFHEIK